MLSSSSRKTLRYRLQNLGSILRRIQQRNYIPPPRARYQATLVVVSCPDSTFSQLGCRSTLTALLEMLRELFRSRLGFLRVVGHRNYELALLLPLRVGHDVCRCQERVPQRILPHVLFGMRNLMFSWKLFQPVSYTHLTLPTNLRV